MQCYNRSLPDIRHKLSSAKFSIHSFKKRIGLFKLKCLPSVHLSQTKSTIRILFRAVCCFLLQAHFCKKLQSRDRGGGRGESGDQELEGCGRFDLEMDGTELTHRIRGCDGTSRANHSN